MHDPAEPIDRYHAWVIEIVTLDITLDDKRYGERFDFLIRVAHRNAEKTPPSVDQ